MSVRQLSGINCFETSNHCKHFMSIANKYDLHDFASSIALHFTRDYVSFVAKNLSEFQLNHKVNRIKIVRTTHKITRWIILLCFFLFKSQITLIQLTSNGSISSRCTHVNGITFERRTLAKQNAWNIVIYNHLLHICEQICKMYGDALITSKKNHTFGATNYND